VGLATDIADGGGHHQAAAAASTRDADAVAAGLDHSHCTGIARWCRSRTRDLWSLSHLHMPIRQVAAAHIMQFIIMQQYTCRRNHGAQFCNMLHAPCSSHEKGDFMQPVHFHLHGAARHMSMRAPAIPGGGIALRCPIPACHARIPNHPGPFHNHPRRM